jgi:hypothetical protein
MWLNISITIIVFFLTTCVVYVVIISLPLKMQICQNIFLAYITLIYETAAHNRGEFILKSVHKLHADVIIPRKIS